MIKTMFALGTLALVAAVPATAQMASGPAAGAPAGGMVPKCSATVRDSCDQGANNPAAMTADQAMATGGVGDRASDNAARMPAKPMMMHKKKMTHHHHMMKSMAGTTTTDSTTTTTPQ